jgi:hypothetical protein
MKCNPTVLFSVLLNFEQLKNDIMHLMYYGKLVLTPKITKNKHDTELPDLTKSTWFSFSCLSVTDTHHVMEKAKIKHN